jgi:transcriptional regulator with XRE-family HTH domain
MRPGERLKEIRFRLGFTLRDVAVLSRDIAKKEGNVEYYISNPWLTQLENREATPSIHKLFTLSCIYGVGFTDLLLIFGVDDRKTTSYHLQLPMQKTHPLNGDLHPTEPLAIQPKFDGVDLSRTTLLSHMLQVWGDLPVELFRRLNFVGSQYGYIGLDDHSLDPLLRPGTFVQIDPEVRKILPSSVHVELDRPIYFVELRDGYACSWCEQDENDLLLVPHPLSGCKTRRFAYPTDAEIIGRVTAIAMQIAAPVQKHSIAIHKSVPPTDFIKEL